MTRRRSVEMVLALLAALGVVTPASAQLGGSPAEQWAITLESGRRMEGLEIEQVVRNLHLEGGEVVADIGAGTGIFSVPIATAVGPSGQVLSVEVDPGFLPMIDAKARASNLPNIVTVLGEFEDPSLPRHDLDMAFFHDVLHHIGEREAYLKKTAEYIAPGGRIAIVDYDGTHPDAPHQDQPEMLITEAEVDQWMTAAGFHRERQVDQFEEKFFLIYQKH